MSSRTVPINRVSLNMGKVIKMHQKKFVTNVYHVTTAFARYAATEISNISKQVVPTATSTLKDSIHLERKHQVGPYPGVPGSYLFDVVADATGIEQNKAMQDHADGPSMFRNIRNKYYEGDYASYQRGLDDSYAGDIAAKGEKTVAEGGTPFMLKAVRIFSKSPRMRVSEKAFFELQEYSEVIRAIDRTVKDGYTDAFSVAEYKTDIRQSSKLVRDTLKKSQERRFARNIRRKEVRRNALVGQSI